MVSGDTHLLRGMEIGQMNLLHCCWLTAAVLSGGEVVDRNGLVPVYVVQPPVRDAKLLFQRLVV